MSDIVDADTAEFDFDRFIEAMDIDANTSKMDDEEKASFKKLKNRLIRAIQKGGLAINDDGEAVYTPQNPKSDYPESITFRERTGASLMATDGKKKNQDAAKTYAMMADMTGLHPAVFSKLVGSDIKICEAIFVLLMD